MIRLRVVAGLVAGVLAVAGTVLGVGSASALPGGCTQAPFQSTVRCTFTYTGTQQTFVVPRGLRSVVVSATGARGGGPTRNSPTVASKITTSVPTVGGQRLYVFVGGAGQTASRAGQLAAGGYNGGASGRPGGGGGASDVRTVGGDPASIASLQSRLVVAAGAGGSARTRGGDGGRPGESNSDFRAAGGGAGGLSRGGSAEGTGQPGRFGQGGIGYTGGGGAGGFFGGGSGSADAGGGGGSSFPAMPFPVFTSSGAQVTISYPGPCFPFCSGS